MSLETTIHHRGTEHTEEIPFDPLCPPCLRGEGADRNYLIRFVKLDNRGREQGTGFFSRLLRLGSRLPVSQFRWGLLSFRG
jgi:hypothetical protein